MNYKLFNISNFFELISDKTINNASILKEGDFPLIGAKKDNNGIVRFVIADKINLNHSISWNKTGDGGAGLSYYQPYCFANSTSVFILKPRIDLNRYQMLYFVTLLNQYYGIFNHGYSLTKNRFKELLIPVPINNNGKPDYIYMRQYMKNMEYKLINKYKEYINNKLKESYLENNLGELEWKEFKINDLFDVKGTKTTSIKDLEIKKETIIKYPYITTKSGNNGVDGFYYYFTEENNIITVDSATDGNIHYQKFSFSASDHVEKLIPKFNMNYHIAQFIVTCLRVSSKEKYNYGYKFNQKRIKDQIFLLPVNNKNKPNYEYMEQYMRNMEYKLLKKYLKRCHL